MESPLSEPGSFIYILPFLGIIKALGVENFMMSIFAFSLIFQWLFAAH